MINDIKKDEFKSTTLDSVTPIVDGVKAKSQLYNKMMVDIKNNRVPPVAPVLAIKKGNYKIKVCLPSAISVVSGKAGSRKSFFIDAIMATVGVKGNFTNFITSNLTGKRNKVVYIDTEQGLEHIARMGRVVERLIGVGDYQLPDNITFSTWSNFSRIEKRSTLQEVIEDDEVALVILDNIRDLLDPSNEKISALEIGEWLKKLALNNKVHVMVTLHQNKSDNNTQGHLGTILQHLSDTVFSLEELDNNSSEISYTKSRNGSWEPLTLNLVDDFNHELTAPKLSITDEYGKF